MITNENTVSISQMRKEADKVLAKVDTLDQPVYLFSRSKIKAVLLNPDKFSQMQEMVENYLDQQELLGIPRDELSQAENWDKVRAEISA